MDPTKILQRHPANPLLDPDDFPGINTLFNPSPFLLEGKICLLVSVTKFNGGPEGRFRETRLATSEDGIHFTLADQALIDQESLPPPVNRLGGIIDNRVTKIGEEFYFISPQGTWEIGFSGCCAVMYKTRDFKDIECVDIVTLPGNRGSSLFPEKIGGFYWRLDRPGEGEMKGTVWISRSPDLIHWGHFRPLLAGGYAMWNTAKIGPTPPIRVAEGWLVILHGVDQPCDGTHYYISAMLLDAENPGKILGKMHSYLLAPRERYETTGQVDNVVFPCGALAFPERDELWLYYGAADTRVCLAVGTLSHVVEACLKQL